MPTSSMNDVVQKLRRRALLGDDVQCSDTQLLNRFISHRDATAFAALVQRHGPMVWGVCRRVLADYHDAEDAFQATFLVLVRKAASIVPRHMVGNWLYGVARQTACKARTMNARRRVHERQVSPMPEAVAATDADRDLREALDRELAGLPDAYRATIVVCDLQGKTRREAAQQLGWAEGTVASRLARARALLAKRLARSGVTLSGAALAAILAGHTAAAAAPIPATTLLASSLGIIPVSPRVTFLADGVVKTMLLCKLKKTIAVLFVLVLLATIGTGSGLLPAQSPGRRTEPDVPPPAGPALTDEQAGPVGGKKPPTPGAPIPPEPPNDADPDAMLAFVLRNCARAMESLQRCSAVCRCTRVNSTLGKTETYDGAFTYLGPTADRPAQSLIEMVNRSKVDKFLVAGTEVREFDSGRKVVRVHKLPPPRPNQSEPRSIAFELLVGTSIVEVLERYQLRWVPAPKYDQQLYHYIQIRPKTAAEKQGFTKARLVVSATDYLPRQLWYQQADGDEITWDFTVRANDKSVTAQKFAAQRLPIGWRIEQVANPSRDAATGPGKEPPTLKDRIEPGDRLWIEVPYALPDQPIKGVFRIEPGGTVPFGFTYGRVAVQGMTPEQAEKRIHEHLARVLKEPQVRVIWYDPVVHGADASVERRMQQLEREVRELRDAIDRLGKQRRD